MLGCFPCPALLHPGFFVCKLDLVTLTGLALYEQFPVTWRVLTGQEAPTGL